MSLFSRMTPENAEALVVKLDKKLSEAIAAVATAQSAAGATALTVELSPTKEALEAKEKASNTLAKAEGLVGELTRTIVAAKAEHAEALRIADKNRDARLWTAVEKLAAKREALGKELTEEVDAIMEKYFELARLGGQMFDLAPKKNCHLNSSLLAPSHVETCLRMHFRKQGARWAINWPWAEDQILTLSRRIMEGNEWIQSFRNAPPEELPAGGDAEPTEPQ